MQSSFNGIHHNLHLLYFEFVCAKLPSAPVDVFLAVLTYGVYELHALITS